jgi:hypothetical protein
MHVSSIDWPIAVSVATIVNVLATICLGVATSVNQRQIAKIQREQAKFQQQQTEINARSFRLSLFEKRMAVFESTAELLAHVAQTSRVEVPQLFDLQRKTRDHEFLFGPEVAKFIDEIYNKGITLSAGQAQPRDPRTYQEEVKLTAWFSDQLHEAKKVFLPYIDFRKP